MVRPADDLIPKPQGVPCSHAQRRFWVLDRLDPGDPALNVAVRWRLEGSVPVAMAERAFRLVITRHEVLRSYFEHSAGEPVQFVAPTVAFKIPVIDLSHLPLAEALAEGDRIARTEALASFDLGTPPLIRVTLLRLNDELSYLLVTAHHTVCDGWSIGILAREFGEICAATHAGRFPVLPELPVSYRDFAEWQNEQLTGPGWQHESEYWATALKGLSYFELRPDRPRSATQGGSCEIISTLLDRGFTGALEQLARRNGCTLFMTVLAGLFVLLHRHSGETDIAIGTQVAGRDEIELEDLVGVFINTLILRADLRNNPSFSDMLARVSDVVTEAFEHQHIPLEKLIEILRPAREPDRNPFFSINFIYQRSFIQNATYGGFKLIDVPSVSAGTVYDLNFFMVERPEGWRLSCEYKTGLFDATTVERFLEHLRILLESAVSDAARPIALLPMLGQAERRHLLAELNDTAASFPSNQTLHGMFAAQAARTPEAIALVFEGAALTYAELDARSNQLAAHLRGLGVGPEVLVAICAERSLELLVGLYGILKAGGAYVPLDPKYPPERLQFMLRDCGARVLLAQEATRDRLAAHEITTVSLDRDWPTIARQPTTAVVNDAGPDNLAYVIYTSGSTGQPKGAMNAHRGIVNRLMWMQQAYRLVAEDRVLQKTPISFDVSVWELFWPLLYGARLVIARPGGHQDPAYLADAIQSHGVTIAHFVPSMLNLFLEGADLDRCGSLRDTMCSGEALSADAVNAFLQRLPHSRLHNLYGPTEAAVDVTSWQCEPLPAGALVPIGRPIANIRLYILDAQRQVSPLGTPGELYIGGVGVGRGYLNRAQLTRERFIDSPFVAGERLYRTGDLVRYRPDGNIEFLGRLDHQVKLRGLRIELGEIEVALRECAGVHDAAVIVREDRPGDQRLTAYYVAQEEASAFEKELRARLAARLPDYMVPAAFVRLQALPLNPNGKLDRVALPRPESGASAAAAAPQQRLDETESRLAALWREVLHCTEVSQTASFFELGGHSLLAARLLGRIEAEFGRRLTLAALFKSPTIADQAAVLRQRENREYEFRQVVKLQANGSKPGIIAVHNTGSFYGLCKRLGPEQPFTSLQLFDPSLPDQKLPQTVEEIAAGYVQLIRRVQPVGPYVLAGWCIAGVLAYEVARQLQSSGEEVSALLLMDTWAPGYLKRLPRLRAELTEYFYRWKLILREWHMVRTGTMPLHQFISNRVIVQRLRRLLRSGAPAQPAAANAATRALADVRYDRWLLDYLGGLVRRYEAHRIPLRVVLFRASLEPHGFLLDEDMGWTALAGAGVSNLMVTGDHFSMFQSPGVDAMAKEIANVIDTLDEAAS
ncbi:MAG TPA: amino acid adenylation domain-containing protein [Steroidobacteraceae bacterium]|nr:amino acid adenylation domain-containing protein [Steroidobacteraceae bacterium]